MKNQLTDQKIEKFANNGTVKFFVRCLGVVMVMYSWQAITNNPEVTTSTPTPVVTQPSEEIPIRSYNQNNLPSGYEVVEESNQFSQLGPFSAMGEVVPNDLVRFNQQMMLNEAIVDLQIQLDQF
jgi:hypothetical protein